MKNRIIALSLILVMSLSLIACGTQATTSEPEPQTETISTEPQTEQISTEAVTPETEKETETSLLEEETTETESKADEQLQSEAGQTTSEESNYTVTPMTATMYAQQAVNLRQGPGTNYDKTGSLSTNQSVEVTGYTDVASGKWYQLSNGSFVSSKYLKDTQVSTTTKPSNNTNNTGNSTGGASNNTTSQPAQSSTEQTASPSGSGDGSGSSRGNRSGSTLDDASEFSGRGNLQ